MTEKAMPGLARMIKLSKDKSHIIRTVLDDAAAPGTGAAAPPEACPVLHDAISDLRPDQLRREHLPAAIEELKEIRRVTEQSVDTIMEQAEGLMECEGSMDGAISILEACAFQDLVGQRISRVSELLESLEERFHGLVHETGVEDNLDAIGEEEQEIERRRKELILHGPQNTGEGVSQDDIDALLGA